MTNEIEALQQELDDCLAKRRQTDIRVHNARMQLTTALVIAQNAALSGLSPEEAVYTMRRAVNRALQWLAKEGERDE